MVGSKTNPDNIKTWAYSYQDCLALTTGLNKMQDFEAVNVQMTYKEEAKARINWMEWTLDWPRALREKLAVCIYPLNPNEHPRGIINTVTGEVIRNESINVDQATELGNKQQEAFEAGWPKSFHEPVKGTVVTCSANKKAIDVIGLKHRGCRNILCSGTCSSSQSARWFTNNPRHATYGALTRCHIYV